MSLNPSSCNVPRTPLLHPMLVRPRPRGPPRAARVVSSVHMKPGTTPFYRLMVRVFLVSAIYGSYALDYDILRVMTRKYTRFEREELH